MHATWEKLEKNWMKFTVEVDAKAVNRAIDQAYKKLVLKANIPGFRRGKAPRFVFERFYGKESLLSEATDDLLSQAYTDAVADADITPIDRPEIDAEPAVEGQPYTFSGKVQVKPEVTMGRVAGFDVPYPDATVSAEQIDHRIEEFRGWSATLEPDPEGVVQTGSFATVDFEGFQDGQPVEGTKAEGFNMEIGSGRMIPGFEEKLIGVKAGDSVEFEIPFPEDYPVEHLRGKHTSFKVTVRDVKKRVLPEVNDAFAATVSRFQTLQELRDDITNRLGESAKAQAERDYRNQLVEAVAAEATVELPDVLVHRRVHEMMEDLAENLQRQGGSIEQYLQSSGKDYDALHHDLHEPAEKQVKIDLTLEALAKQTGLALSDQEIDAEFAAMGTMYKGKTGDLIKAQKNPQFRDRVRASLLKQRAVAYLVDQNRLSAGTVTDDAGVEPDAADDGEKAAAKRKPTRAKRARAADEAPDESVAGG